MQIGIVGAIGAGKDTVASILTKHYPFERVRYADPLKCAAEYVFGRNFDDRSVKEVPVPIFGTNAEQRIIDAALRLSGELGFTGTAAHNFKELLHSELLKPTLSPRTFQQLLGTDVCRQVKPDCFVELVKSKQNIVVPDVRFENEILPVTILVDNGTYSESKHISEQLAREMLSNPYKYNTEVYYVPNKGSLASLEKLILDLGDYIGLVKTA